VPLPPASAAGVEKLLAQFRRSAGAPEERAKAVDELLKFGGRAPALLLDAINRELQPLWTRYQADFTKQAAAALAKGSAGNGTEIESLRQTVVALGQDAGLTHEKIVAKADPAMKRLRELLLVDRDAVVKQAPALETRRADLLELGKHWQRVTGAATAKPPTPDGPAAAPVQFEDLLRGFEETCFLVILATNDRSRETLRANSGLEAKLSVEEARGMRDLNRIRLLLGLKPVRIDLALCDAARDPSKDMVEKKFFSHDSPVPGKKTPWNRAKNFGTSASAENIAAGTRTGEGAIDMWFHSPGHHRNMLGRHSRGGLGQFAETWTQMFG